MVGQPYGSMSCLRASPARRGILFLSFLFLICSRQRIQMEGGGVFCFLSPVANECRCGDLDSSSRARTHATASFDSGSSYHPSGPEFP